MKWLIVVVNIMVWGTILAGFAPPGSCPPVCACKWKGGKQTVECVDRALITVPEPVDPATQVLDLSGNNLQILPQEAFARTGLVNLQRVYLRSCNIGQINDRAFKGLTNLVELDLSHNLLTQVPSSSFKDAPFLRDLTLSHNPIIKIHAEALSSLGSIVKLDLSKCDIRDIASDAFRNSRSLESLKLNHNNLRDLPLSSLEKLEKLRVIDLSDNPWTCDCRLRDLKMWLAKHKLLSTPTCSSPARLTNKLFSELTIEEFACKPEILPNTRNAVARIGENATVVCKTEGVPSANVNWYWNGRLLQNGSSFNNHQKIIILEEGELKKKSSLILTNVQDSDPIEFYCVAENKGGNAEANFTVHVSQIAGMASLDSAQIASLGAALFLLIVVISLGLLITFVRFRPSPSCESKTPNTLDRVVSGNEVHPTTNDRPHVAVLANRQESPNYNDTKCNPVVKPPRVGDMPYTTNHYEGRGSIVTAGGPVMVSPTISAGIDPDLINDTRPDSVARPGSGEYARETSDSLYPSGLWEQIKMNQASSLARAVSTALPSYYTDRTPIIENSSVNGSQEELGYMSRTFPRSHAMTGVTTAPIDSSYPPDYGPPAAAGAQGATGARTLRVWQRAPPVLPPVSALKRVLTITRPATEDGFHDGCATDV
ncbi:PREDICTED: leucine-rich repeat, immunoglobulin-like domain and transmembrane domain-containing protein 2 [Papilio polytes]|uniref:leucine-rich repeat, immunoglobulin-like domain and transmembrane domain-containing protein 2 n=1 Tax=Papilio polytes TaxID=76194 RepID=UPI0006767019|nr:PREDICTED: leucine-rich repeat, immunoglobulin-like domain and transmembrane domain-containing protein 2 [Papilio polytes]